MHGGAYTLVALLDRRVGQPYDSVGESPCDGDFNCYDDGVDTVDCSSEGLDKHGVQFFAL